MQQSAEATCRAEAEFRVNQNIITHFKAIIALLLPVMTVMMFLYYMSLHHYYDIIA